MINYSLQKQLPEITGILSRHYISRAYIFGSACTDHFNEKSDVDFLISFREGLDPVEQGEQWWNLLFELEDYLHHDVDLLTENSLRNPYLIESINKQKQLIYAT